MIYNIYKPVGWTSFDIVKKIRSITKEKKVGHGGTLDPFAEGVLIIGTGKETKILSKVSDEQKSYQAIIQLGSETDTFDNEGKIIKESPIPLNTENQIKREIKNFLGEYFHKPPMYSAKKINGVPLYKLARQNIEVDRKEIKSTIFDISLNDFSADLINFSVTCSKGTYVRVLGSDIARKLGTVGHLIKLIRTSVGSHQVSNSLSVENFEDQWKYLKK
jgi:tRNA pseudouridine55 synthase